MTIINITATINTITMTLAAVDPPTMAPIEVVLVLVVVVVLVLLLVYTNVHSVLPVPFSGNTRFLPTLTFSANVVPDGLLGAIQLISYNV